MEEWDIYDKNRIKTKKVVKRGIPLRSNEFHMVVHVCIINPHDQMLIQQRQPSKDWYPNMWDLTAGGGAQSSERSSTAAEREVFEEIGLKVDLASVRPSFTINFERGFDDYYVITADVDISKLSLQKSEVKNVKWVSKAEIVRMIENKEFIPYHISLIELIFDMKNGYGSHSNNC